MGLDRATLLGCVAIVLWSTTVAIARSLAEQLGPLRAAAAIYLLGGMLALGRTMISRGVSASFVHPRRYLLGCGGLFVGYTVALFMGVGLASTRVQVLEVGLLNYLWPTLTLLLSLILLDHRAHRGLFPGTFAALAGEYFVLTQATSITWRAFADRLTEQPLVYGFGLTAAITWALYSNLTRRWSQERQGEGGVPLFMLATGIVLLAFSVLEDAPATWQRRTLIEVGFLGTVTAASYGFWDTAMRQGRLVLVVSASYFTPFLSTLVSCLYLRVTPGIKLWIGCALIVAGSLMSWASISASSARVASFSETDLTPRR